MYENESLNISCTLSKTSIRVCHTFSSKLIKEKYCVCNKLFSVAVLAYSF